MINRSSSLFLVLLLLFSMAMPAAADEYDNTYQTIVPPQPTTTGDKIEVLEVFWYGCPHCYHFEAYIHRWLKTKPADVEFVRMPAVLSRNWLPHAKAYYAAIKLDVLNRIHTPLFNALHRDGKRIFTEDELRNFFVSQGVDGEAFTKAYESTEVQTKIKQAFYLARNFKITGVPSIVVDGKYMTSASMTGSYDKLLEVVNYLIKKVRAEKQAAAGN
jgi:thiol:disulfide interchange protein DsbA